MRLLGMRLPTGLIRRIRLCSNVTKVVQLSDIAYARLRTVKRDDESFSDAVLRILSTRELTALRGLRSARDTRAAEDAIRAADTLDKA